MTLIQRITAVIQSVASEIKDRIHINKLGAASGVATLDEEGKILTEQLPVVIDINHGITLPSINIEPTESLEGTIYYDPLKRVVKLWTGVRYEELNKSFNLLGGEKISIGEYDIHTFNISTTIIVSGYGFVDYLVVGGGGGSGFDVGGGGGGGGVVSGSIELSEGMYTIVIGAGGVSSNTTNVKGTNGGDSYFSSISALGGGGGGSYSSAGIGRDGSSGGGGGFTSASGGLGTLGQGYVGGASSNTPYGSGGGGGAGGPGENGVGGIAVNGGIGILSNITGTNIMYGGGGYGNSDNGVINNTGYDKQNNFIGFYGFGANGQGSGTVYNGNRGVVIIKYKKRSNA